MNLEMPYGPICAKVNNKVEGMHFRLYHNKDVEFLDMHSGSGSRNYTRTLFFILCKAVHDLYPKSEVVIDIPVSNGYYVDLQIGPAVTLEHVDNIRRRMQESIDAKIPVTRHEVPTEDAVRMFEEKGDEPK
jgi:uridine kinase